MNKISTKVISIMMTAVLVFCLGTTSAFAATDVDYVITNPYESVAAYLGNLDNHYKTNLHTHSTYSDATITLTDMVKEHYAQDFDVLAMADHGVIGVPWNETPTLIPLYQYSNLLYGQAHLTDEEFAQITAGTLSDGRRTVSNGMGCVTGAIEANYLVAQKNHINGYFMEDSSVEGIMGNEGDFETMVAMIDAAGGVSHINHPGDWLGSAGDHDIARDPENVQFFANLYRKYDSCLGMEIYNAFDRPTSGDRVLWDELLKVVIPEGRNVWGFANNDAHNTDDVDTAFMDFIMPSFSEANVETAMTNGTFFAVSRYISGERIGEATEYPQVLCISVDEANDAITIIAQNSNQINWIADGNVIRTETCEYGDLLSSTIYLREHTDDISCYVRFDLLGEGGITSSQAFVCDDGSMGELVNRGPMAGPNVDIVALIRSILKFFLRSFSVLGF